MREPNRYRKSRRRILIDMQIPDWDPLFLSAYDPRLAVEAATDAGADGLMVYFQSHTGICNWPVEGSRGHRAFQRGDVMKDTLDLAAEHDLPVCAYYSINFNNEAWRDHPDWRFEPASPGMIGGGLLVRERYGICCLNSGGYRDFIRHQISDLLNRYSLDTLFYDMVWWMGVCVCEHCKDRYRSETSREIPTTVDWCDVHWCRFQAARERWLSEFAHELRDHARRLQPGIGVYHNFALGMMNWTRGVCFDSATAHDFLGGDFYGGPDEQLVVAKLMQGLSESQPVEFMTTVTTNLAEHETMKSRDQLSQISLAAACCGSASLMISGIDPEGMMHRVSFDLIKHAFAARAPYESDLGGSPVAEIAVYFSDRSKMSFAENGLALEAAANRLPIDYPHFLGVRGACRKLQAAHLPFCVITAKQLGDLAQFAVLVLPDLLRVTEEELTAFREYVRNGGRLYASRYTSLTSSDGRRHENFLLSDLFGCEFEGLESGRMVYLEPATTFSTRAIQPQRRLRLQINPDDGFGLTRIRPLTGEDGLRVEAHLNTPYGHPSSGSIEAEDWAAIHSSPPWKKTDHPVLVRNRYGDGEVIYSAANVEADEGDAHGSLFVALIRELLMTDPAFEAIAHPSLWMSVFDQPERSRLLITLLNYTSELPVLESEATIRLRPPWDQRFVDLKRLPDAESANFELDSQGFLSARLEGLSMCTMFVAGYVAS